MFFNGEGLGQYDRSKLYPLSSLGLGIRKQVKTGLLDSSSETLHLAFENLIQLALAVLYVSSEQLSGCAYPQAFVPQTIRSGSRVSGCYPFNKAIFTDDKYLTYFVTDQSDEVPPREEVTQQPGTTVAQHATVRPFNQAS